MREHLSDSVMGKPPLGAMTSFVSAKIFRFSSDRCQLDGVSLAQEARPYMNWDKLNNPFGISLVLAAITVIAYFCVLEFPPMVTP